MGGIAPGDWLEALKTWPPMAFSQAVTAGKLYCVAAIDPEPAPCLGCGDEGHGFALVGDSAPAIFTEGSWCHCSFKPIHRPRPEFIEELLAPPVKAPNRVREPA